MFADAIRKNSVASLVLRLALAGIFITHGLNKVMGEGNGLGASWAYNFWRHQVHPPESLLNQVRELPASKRPRQVEEALVEIYSKSAPNMPTALYIDVAQVAVAWGELLGGIALLIGLLVRVAATGLFLIQIGAIVLITWRQDFTLGTGAGYEFNLGLVAMCLAVLILGSGSLSVDRALFRRRKVLAPVAALAPTPEVLSTPR